MITATKPVPAYAYTTADGHRFEWNGGPWITVTTANGTLLSHVQAPETRTATALIAVADAWQVEDRRGWENSYRP